MSTEQALVITTVVVFAALALAYQSIRLWQQASETIAAALDEELDLDDHTPAFDLDAGCAQLLQAIRDEQQKGDTA